MDREELKKALKESLNLRVDFDPWESRLRIIIEFDGEEICSSGDVIKVDN